MHMMTTIYHRDIGFPSDALMPRPGMLLEYSRHALQSHVRTEGDLLPDRLPSAFEVIEITMFGGRAAHWVVRFPLFALVGGKRVRQDQDAVLALGFRGAESLNVRTVYFNHKDDRHESLRRERYARPA